MEGALLPPCWRRSFPDLPSARPASPGSGPPACCRETASAASVKLQNVRPGDASEAQSRLAEAHALGIKDSLGAHPRRSVGGEHMVRKPSGRPARMQHQRHNLDAQIVAAETERD